MNYYEQLYVVASLNQYVSNIDHEIWRKSGTNTNNAEAAHAIINKEGKQLSLLSAILRLVSFIIIFLNCNVFINNFCN